MKIAIATDTNSGITAIEGEKLGVFVLAMPVNLEETIHYEGIDITSEQLYDAMRQHRDVFTSQPSPGQLMELWDGILAKGYDEIVYIPMSSGLSGSCQSAALFAQDYDGKVHVEDNHRISVTQRESVISALRLAEHWRQQVQAEFPFAKVSYANLPCSIACHVGMNSVAAVIMTEEVQRAD